MFGLWKTVVVASAAAQSVATRETNEVAAARKAEATKFCSRQMCVSPVIQDKQRHLVVLASNTSDLKGWRSHPTASTLRHCRLLSTGRTFRPHVNHFCSKNCMRVSPEIPRLLT